MIKIIYILAAAVLLSSNELPAATAEVFGFSPGMTKDQAEHLVPLDAVLDQLNWFIAHTAPKPHPEFESYILVFDPQLGLVKIVAIGNERKSNIYGEEIKRAFSSLRKGLVSRYGTPSTDADLLRPGSIWNEPKDWMMAVMRGERILASFWSEGLPQGIERVELHAQATDRNTGFLHLNYFFEGHEEAEERERAREADVL